MLAFWQERLVYLAVPKTGSTAIESVFEPHADIIFRNPPRLKHAKAGTMRNFKKLFSPVDPSEFELVAVMREPLDWLGSWYRYRSRDDLDGHPNSTKHISFDDFLVASCETKPPGFAHIGSQHRFLCADGDVPLADVIFPYEKLNLAIAYLNQRLGTSKQIDRLNRSPINVLDISSDVLELVGQKRRKEIELYEEVSDGKYLRAPKSVL